MLNLRPSLLRSAALGLLLAGALGCSLHKANTAFQEGHYDEARLAYLEVLKSDPQNVKARIGLRRASEQAGQAHVLRAKEMERRGMDDEAIKAELEKSLAMDLDNQVAQDWLVRVQKRIQAKQAAEAAKENVEALQAQADADNPLQLDPRSMEGADLTFVRRTSLKEIFGVLSKAAGINILLHSSFQDASVSVDLKGLTFQRSLDTLMLQNDLFYRVVDRNTIMIFKATPQNREQYENQIIKTYFLSNAEPNDVRQTLTSLIPQLRIFTDKRMNAVIVKAKREELAITDNLINKLDKALPEVMVYAELLEVTESSLEKVGLLPVLGPTDDAGLYRMGATTANVNQGGYNTNNSNLSIKTADIRVLFPNLALDFLKSNGDARMVASPNLRVVSGNKGELMIGDKVSTTQSQIGGFGVGGAGTGATGATGGITGALNTAGLGQTQYGYEDVGVKISVEPRVHYNDEISLKLEASVTTQKAGSSPGRPDLGRREIKTFARLRDGETAIFGGLLKDEEQKQLQGIWGLSEIPIINRLFGNTHTTKAKTDVILTLRAVLVRKPNFSEDDFKGFNPDDAISKQGPFAAKAPAKGATVSTTTAAPGKGAPAPSPAPAAPAKGQPADASAPKDAAALAKEAAQPPASSDLVFFVSPTTADLGQGEHIEVALSVSGGKGLDSGYLDLRIPAGLKLANVSAGDFLTTDAGTLQQSAPKEGLVRISFKRAGQGGDSGTLAVIELEAAQPGNAPVLIEGGQFLAGANPLSARWVSALYTIH